MSKTPSHPIILKKDDNNRPSRGQNHQPIQPKILVKSSTKVSTKENAPSVPVIAKKVVESDGPAPPQLMRKCQRLVVPHFQLEQRILDFLDAENSDFLVVATVGSPQVGKSTIVNVHLIKPHEHQLIRIHIVDEHRSESRLPQFIPRTDDVPQGAGNIYKQGDNSRGQLDRRLHLARPNHILGHFAAIIEHPATRHDDCGVR